MSLTNHLTGITAVIRINNISGIFVMQWESLKSKNFKEMKKSNCQPLGLHVGVDPDHCPLLKQVMDAGPASA